MEPGGRGESGRERRGSVLIKEQVLIIKVKYDDSYDNSPHAWDWSRLVGSEYEIEVMNHGAPDAAKQN